MNTTYSEIYFVIASVSTIIVAGVFLLCTFYIASILHDIKRLSKIAKREAETIARSFEKGAEFFGGELSNEASSFLRTVFALLMSQVVKKTRSKSRIRSK